MAQPQQMLDRLSRAVAIVGPDIRQRAADHASHRHDRRHGVRPLLGDRPRVRTAGRAHDDAGDIVLAQGSEHLRLTIGILIGVGEDRHEAEMIKGVLDADGELGEERIGEIADDHADEVGRGGAQAGGAAMIDVAERPHGPAYALARLRRDQIAAPTELAKRSISTRRPGVRHRRSSPDRFARPFPPDPSTRTFVSRRGLERTNWMAQTP